jgi:DNA polymerase III subunit delta
MLIFLYGKDSFRSRQQLKKMIDKFKSDRDPDGYNVARLDCEKEETGKVLEQLLAIPFLAPKRMVVLENLLVSKNKELRADILKRVEEKTLPETNIIIFWEGNDKFRTKDAKTFMARLVKEKYVQLFDELFGAKLSGWIAGEVVSREGKINNSAINYLSQHVGGDMWRLNTIIDQLIVYRSGEDIRVEDVELFLEQKVDDNIFNLVDAIVGGRTEKVFGMIQEQYRQGKDPLYVFAMILRQFRILIELRDLFDRDSSMQSNVMAKKLGIHPFVVKKSFPFVQRYDMGKLKNIYKQLLEFDIQTKTGQGDPLVLLDVFVGKVCAN